MVLEDMILRVQLHRDHPLLNIAITLREALVIPDSRGGEGSPVADLFPRIIDDLHQLYRLVARRKTKPRGTRLPSDARPRETSPHWVHQEKYCYSFVDQEGNRYADVTLADDNKTILLSSSTTRTTPEMELFYETLLHYVPK